MRKANKLAKAVAHGGYGDEAREDYLMKYLEAKKIILKPRSIGITTFAKYPEAKNK